MEGLEGFTRHVCFRVFEELPVVCFVYGLKAPEGIEGGGGTVLVDLKDLDSCRGGGGGGGGGEGGIIIVGVDILSSRQDGGGGGC